MKTDVLSLIHAPRYAESVLSGLTDRELAQLHDKLMTAIRDPRVRILLHLLSTFKELIDAEQAARAETQI